MKALTFDGVGKIKVVDKDVPKITQQSQALVKMLRTTICGTDLHIIKGDVPTVDKGRTLGHEGVGVVEEVGNEVKNYKKGDKVLIACITSCATCNFCKRRLTAVFILYDACKSGGWRLGHVHDGTQAEYLLCEYADSCLYPVPEGADERALLVFSDILPTGLEVGVLRGQVKPGSTVAIVGAGPVGLAAGITAQFYAPKTLVFFDKDKFRLEVAKKIGATATFNISDPKEAREASKEYFGDIDGFDVVIEAVGVPETWDMCQELVGIGGNLANCGVHGKGVNLAIDRLWPRSTTISMALVSSYTIPLLLELNKAGKINTEDLITHDFKFSEIEKAYDIFGKAAENKALKMNITFD